MAGNTTPPHYQSLQGVVTAASRYAITQRTNSNKRCTITTWLVVDTTIYHICILNKQYIYTLYHRGNLRRPSALWHLPFGT